MSLCKESEGQDRTPTGDLGGFAHTKGWYEKMGKLWEKQEEAVM